jgi:hypothetical protein
MPFSSDSAKALPRRILPVSRGSASIASSSAVAFTFPELSESTSRSTEIGRWATTEYSEHTEGWRVMDSSISWNSASAPLALTSKPTCVGWAAATGWSGSGNPGNLCPLGFRKVPFRTTYPCPCCPRSPRFAHSWVTMWPCYRRATSNVTGAYSPERRSHFIAALSWESLEPEDPDHCRDLLSSIQKIGRNQSIPIASLKQNSFCRNTNYGIGQSLLIDCLFRRFNPLKGIFICIM